MAVSIVIDIKENSWSVANNTSNVTVKVNAKWTYESYNQTSKSGSCTIDGTKYTFTSPFNTGKTTSGSCNLYTKTLNITHNSDGTKELVTSASYTSGVSSGTVAASAKKTLTTIPRKSTLSVANGTLGTAQTLTVARQSDDFTHSIKAVCGKSTLYIKADGSTQTSEVKHTDCSIPFTPPLSWASQNTSGQSVSVTYTITTYNGSTSVGSNPYTKTYDMPASIKPSCVVSVTDPTGNFDKFGAYIQGASKFSVVVTPTTSYGSAIKSYSTTADNARYTSASFTTGLLTRPGQSTIAATVTDNRERSGTDSATVTVLEYTKPTITKLAAQRCDANGTANNKGAYIKVIFSASISSLSGKNTATYLIEYKSTADSNYPAENKIPLTACEGNFNPVNAEHIFAADASVSYDIKLTATDGITDTPQATVVSTGFKFISQRVGGTGIAFGKVAEEDDLFDVGWSARFTRPVYGKVAGLDKLPSIPGNSDLNDYMQTGCWAVYRNDDAETIANMPIARAGRLEVISATGEGIRETAWSYLRQRFTPYNAENAVWQRDITRSDDNVWRFYDWWQSSLTPDAAEKVYSKAAITIALSANATLGIVSAYTKIPLDKLVVSTSDRLTMQSNSVRIGANINCVKVSGQTLVKCGSQTGNRHAKIQKVSGSTTTAIAWDCVYGVATSNTLYPFTPAIVPVKEGDLLYMTYYTSDATDMNAAGSTGGGWQTYLTVEEL